MRLFPWPNAITWSTAICWTGLLVAQSSAPAGGNPPIPPVKTSITVTDRIAADAPASVSTLDQTRIGQVPGVNLDDRLRIVPGCRRGPESPARLTSRHAQVVDMAKKNPALFIPWRWGEQRRLNRARIFCGTMMAESGD